MIYATFKNKNEITVSGLWQYDFGQILEINGLDIPDGTSIHFAQEGKTIEGTVRNKQVVIPDYFLQFYYDIYVYIYIKTETEGKTIARIIVKINTRKRPPDYVAPDEPSYTRLLPEGWSEDDYLTVKDGKLVWVKLDAEFASNADLVQVAESVPQFATMTEIENILNMED